MKLKNALFSLTAAAMLAAPVAAQAGTKASASTGQIASLSGIGQRKSAPVKAKQKADSAIIALAVIGAGAAGYGIYEAVKDKSNGS
ncbi:hypothetical protein [Novosphingobium sp. P6W]|uniref:hypothetical protein n=1 Tax=Novosphingobium sp. P6W TaxID=1609758 RepID=UPI0005C31C2D|nr:hypothetical protein [Novosphingobium sp. P6W]AXB80647.1 hypothetical protein TQ38_029190 [Novosphingobium sp. P6W]KIS30084.1 hypothetical protein TQ38_24705 [Novosphingobium sp. P6W]